MTSTAPPHWVVNAAPTWRNMPSELPVPPKRRVVAVAAFATVSSPATSAVMTSLERKTMHVART